MTDFPTSPVPASVLDRIEQRLNESGTGEMGLLDTIHAVAAIVREARTSVLAQTPALRDALDNSQSLLAMVQHLGTAFGAPGITSSDWDNEGLTKMIADQITENRAALSNTSTLQPAEDDSYTDGRQRGFGQPDTSPHRCEGCAANYADPPSKLCPGCQAYREHQQ